MQVYLGEKLVGEISNSITRSIRDISRARELRIPIMPGLVPVFNEGTSIPIELATVNFISLKLGKRTATITDRALMQCSSVDRFQYLGIPMNAECIQDVTRDMIHYRWTVCMVTKTELESIFDMDWFTPVENDEPDIDARMWAHSAVM